MSSTWNDEFARLAGPLAVSLGLHLSAVAALEGLPQRVSSAALGLQNRGATRLEVAFRAAPQPMAPQTEGYVPPVAPSLAPPLPEPGGAPEELADATRYFAARDLDVKPEPLAPVDPPYPNDAYLRNIPGRVLVRLTIDAHGVVERAEILRADPPGQFEEAVLSAFRAARFSPGMRGGRPVGVQMTLEVRYHGPQAVVPPPQ
ncbi:MAG TPA: energy transducer TonB [Burkholderiales bacterium]|nr:energy transducer TonB [Burkholderiales bacterium]